FKVRAESGRDGRFRFTVSKTEVERSHHDSPAQFLITVADGYGPDWTSLDKLAQAADLTFRLVKDVAINGRILNLEGKPVAGARVRVESIRAFVNDDVAPYLQAVREGKFEPPGAKVWQGPFPAQAESLVTGADGRFRCTGIGRERVVHFHVEGPSI